MKQISYMPKLRSLNPATEEILAEFDELSAEKAIYEIKKVGDAFAGWAQKEAGERAELIKNLQKTILKNKQEYAELITREMGKPISQSVAEVEKCALLCDYYSKEGPAFLEPEEVKTENKKSYVRYDPLGTILAVMPWNFPFWQLFRVAVPSLLAGNAVVLKHASNVPQCALKIEGIFKEAGFPEHVFKTLLIGSKSIPKIIESGYIDGVSLTGSTKAGSSVGGTAGKSIKKVVLELGGSDPFIVLPDCDIEKTAENAVKARMVNSGQSCIAAKRFIVHEKIETEFTERVKELMERLKVGDPMDKNTNIGPLATGQIRDDVERQVVETAKNGANILLGGKGKEGKGFFFEPTLLGNIRPGMPAYNEELFGPVLPIIPVKSEEETIRVANDTEFGLGASIWTTDTRKAEEVAKRIQTGMVFINKTVVSDPRLPFGGMKKSGIGRELGKWGIREFVNVKAVVVG